MAELNSQLSLRFVKAADMPTRTPLGATDVLDLADRPLGRFDGVLVDSDERARYIVIRRSSDDGTMDWAAAPVGRAWFDETSAVVRMEASTPVSFEPEAFSRAAPAEALAYELELLRRCCPEVSVPAGQGPAYDALAFDAPDWLLVGRAGRRGM